MFFSRRGALLSRSTFPVLAAGVMATLAGAALLWIRRRFQDDPAAVDRVLRWWAGVWLRAAGASLIVRGLENIEPGRAYVVVSNHQSNLDAMAHLRALPLSLRFLAKHELFRMPVLGPAMRAAGMVEVDRRSPDRRRIAEAAGRSLRAGQSVLVYPEGTTSANGVIGAFRYGAFAMAIANQVPILPVAIHGSGRVWPVGRAAIRPGQIGLVIGRPVPVTGLTADDAASLRDQVRGALVAAHADLAAQAAGPARPVSRG